MSDTNARRVLVIDDEEVIRTLSEKILTRFGHSVTLASQGLEGIEAYAEALRAGQPYDVVLIDLASAEHFNGADTLARLREFDPEVCAIVCSGDSSAPAVVSWLKHGFARAIVKPFRAEDLVRVVREATERPR